MQERTEESWRALAEATGKDIFFGFRDRLDDEIMRAGVRVSRLALCLIAQDNEEFIYPYEQARRSLLEDMVWVIRERAIRSGLILSWEYEKLAAVFVDISPSEALERAELMRKALAEHRFERDGEKVNLTVSIGVAIYPEDGVTADDLIHEALGALEQARARGGNGVVAAGSYL